MEPPDAFTASDHTYPVPLPPDAEKVAVPLGATVVVVGEIDKAVGPPVTSSTSSQSWSPALLVPGVVTAWVAVFGIVPALVKTPFVGSHHRARAAPDIDR